MSDENTVDQVDQEELDAHHELIDEVNATQAQKGAKKNAFDIPNIGPKNKPASYYITAGSGNKAKGTSVLATPNKKLMDADGLTSADKSKVLRVAMGQAESAAFDFNATAVVSLHTDFIQTGMHAFDRAVTGNSVAGIPKGAISLFYGKEGCGKSSLACNICQKAIAENKSVAWIDLEQSLDPNLLEAWGIDPEDFKYSVYRPKNNQHEAIFNLYKILVLLNVDVIILDSITAINVYRSDDSNVVATEQMGISAKEMGGFLRQIMYNIKKNNTTAFFISQIRSTLDKYSPDTYPGGNAWGHYASLIVKLTKVCDFINYEGLAIPTKTAEPNIKAIITKLGKEGLGKAQVVGISGGLEILKSRYSPIKGLFLFEYFYGKGFNNIMQIAHDMEKHGILVKKGAHIYVYKEGEFDKKGLPIAEHHWASKNAFKQDMTDHPEIMDDLSNRLQKIVDAAKKNYSINLDVLDANSTSKFTATSNKTRNEEMKELREKAIEDKDFEAVDQIDSKMEIERQSDEDSQFHDAKTKTVRRKKSQSGVSSDEAAIFDADQTPEKPISEQDAQQLLKDASVDNI